MKRIVAKSAEVLQKISAMIAQSLGTPVTKIMMHIGEKRVPAAEMRGRLGKREIDIVWLLVSGISAQMMFGSQTVPPIA
jgi:hypothetical protein